MYSVRRRLMLILAVGFGILIVGTGVYMESFLREHVTEEFDTALLAKAQTLVSLTERDERGQIELDYDSAHMREYEREDAPEYFQFWLDDGMVLLRSKQLKNDLPRSTSFSIHPSIIDAPLPDGRPGRVVRLAFVPQGPGDEGDEPDEPVDPAVATSGEMRSLFLVVAISRERLDSLLGNMQLAIFGVGGIAMLLAVVLVWRALVTGLRPLDQIAGQVQTLDADNLDSRVALPRTPVELAPVISQLNALLDRLDASFERERRFTGNVAHELRTPIAELRSLAEVGAKWPDDKQSIVRFFEDVTDIAGRMEGVIADLLLLARCHAGVEKVVRSPTDLKQVITATWSRLTSAASSSGLRLSVDVPDDLVVESDPGKLDIVFTNVFGNAVSYARPESEIRCVGTRAGSRFQLDITNTADPLSPSDLEHLAEPFWRKDKARSPADHVGLGLSVVSALAVLLSLQVGFDQDRDGTFRVRLEGPAFGHGNA